jgi:hypothetical protein
MYSLGAFYENREGFVPNSTCEICLDEIVNDTDASIITNCRHFFHTRCLSRWLSRGGLDSTTCPVCRTVVGDLQNLHEYIIVPVERPPVPVGNHNTNQQLLELIQILNNRLVVVENLIKEILERQNQTGVERDVPSRPQTPARNSSYYQSQQVPVQDVPPRRRANLYNYPVFNRRV